MLLTSYETSDETISEATTPQEEVPIIWHAKLMLSITAWPRVLSII